MTITQDGQLVNWLSPVMTVRINNSTADFARRRESAERMPLEKFGVNELLIAFHAKLYQSLHALQ